MSVPFLDLSKQHAELTAELDELWRHAVDGSLFIGGSLVADFEAEFAAFCGARVRRRRRKRHR